MHETNCRFIQETKAAEREKLELQRSLAASWSNQIYQKQIRPQNKYD